MIGLQEMLLQTNGEQILLSGIPKEWNVHFKLHAPGETTVEATLKNGKVTDLKVLPESRKKDIVIMIEKENDNFAGAPKGLIYSVGNALVKRQSEFAPRKGIIVYGSAPSWLVAGVFFVGRCPTLYN